MKLRAVLAGLLLGALPALVLNLPAAWLADAVQRASAGRLLLAETRGTWWRGSAVLALASGNSHSSAIALPGRVAWQLGLQGGRPTAWLQQDCCTPTRLALGWQPGWPQQSFTLQAERHNGADSAGPAGPGPAAAAAPGIWGQWPLALLAGLGAPWNTMRLAGSLQWTAGEPLVLLWQAGQPSLQGQLELKLHRVSSRLSPLQTLGDYRLQVTATPGAAAPQVLLQTTQGPLLLQASGHWDLSGLHLQGQASAEPGSEAGLNNLLNIIGVRHGAVSQISF